MPTNLVRFLAGLIAILALSGFLILYGAGISICLHHRHEPMHKFGDAYVYVATALAGLVGGVAAMLFNEKLPDAPPVPKPNPPSPSADFATPSASGVHASITALRNSITGSTTDVLRTVSAAYVIVYFATGFMAVSTWIIVADNTPDLIKNLALIVIGLFVAIARSFFNIAPSQP